MDIVYDNGFDHDFMKSLKHGDDLKSRQQAAKDYADKLNNSIDDNVMKELQEEIVRRGIIGLSPSVYIAIRESGADAARQLLQILKLKDLDLLEEFHD